MVFDVVFEKLYRQYCDFYLNLEQGCIYKLHMIELSCQFCTRFNIYRLAYLNTRIKMNHRCITI